MDTQFLQDPGWLEVILTGLSIIVSIFLGYKLGRQDTPRASAHLPAKGTLDLVKVANSGLVSDIIRCAGRTPTAAAERGRRPSEKDLAQIRREVTNLIKESREMLQGFQTPVGRTGQVLAELYNIREVEEDYQELERIARPEMPRPDKLERMEKVI